MLNYNMQYQKNQQQYPRRGISITDGQPRNLVIPVQFLKHVGLFWKDGKKVSIIPPLLINNKLESDFEIKANYFNSFFASKCISLINNSTVPKSLQYVSFTRLSLFSFNQEVILKIIYALIINKAHGHNDLSIRMIKLYSKSVVKPLSVIFKSCIDTGTFPDNQKRSNIIPLHKKDDKQILNSDRPIFPFSYFCENFRETTFQFHNGISGRKQFTQLQSIRFQVQ